MMDLDLRLRARLEETANRQARIQAGRHLAWCWLGTALIALGLVLAERQLGRPFSITVPLTIILAVLSLAWAAYRLRRFQPDWRSLARRLEAQFPELDGRLITAVQQRPGENRQLNYLQEVVLREVLRHSYDSDWVSAVPAWKVNVTRGVSFALLTILAATIFLLRPGEGARPSPVFIVDSVNVTPGNVTLERGSSLAIMAQFSGNVPGNATLVMAAGNHETNRITLVKSLSDPTFGAHLPEVTNSFVYSVEYGGRSAGPYRVTVFEYPRLDRADATIHYPDYTGQTSRRIEDVRRLSAVEGSKIDIALQFNKPVAHARLLPRDRKRPALELIAATNHPVASLTSHVLAANETLDLQLVDFEGRTNKVPARFVFEALKNRTPELKLAFPRGDIRPSPIEEVLFEGTAWDDFGVEAFGIGFVRPGKELEYVELGRQVPAREKRPFSHVLKLEDMGVKPDQLVSWFVWADDVAPDGQLRRTPGDLFFAEIRPFDQVFREAQNDGSEDGESSSGQSGQQGGQSGQLVQIQKQILTATWKLQREQGKPLRIPGRPAPATRRQSSSVVPTPGSNVTPYFYGPAHASFPKVFGQAAPAGPERGRSTAGSPGPDLAITNALTDLGVVREAQEKLVQTAKELLERQRDPRSGPLWREAVREMEKALDRLQQALDHSAPLDEAIAAEQAAYEALLKLQEHEFQVSRRRQNQNGQNSGQNQQMQQELQNLDLTQEESRYETRRLAQPRQTPAQREQLQVMNRLQELARRQQDLNDRLKELESALREARTQQEKDEIRRRLKRLQEEEKQMLSDVDELRQRMERPENQSEMAEERQQLEDVRQDVQRASESANEESLSQALASGTRAQRQLQNLREQMRKENSSQFADAMKEMRAQARELAQQQEKLVKDMEAQDRPAKRTLSDDSNQREQLQTEITRQKARMTNLVDQASALSEQAESAEPVVSRQLYDAVRKFTQDSNKAVKEMQDQLIERGMMTRDLYDRLERGKEPDGAKLMDVASEMLRLDLTQQAAAAGRRSQQDIVQLRRGVEDAAANLLGDDAEALRIAEQELNQLSEVVRDEMAREQRGLGSTNGSVARAGSQNPNDLTNAVAGARGSRSDQARAGQRDTNEMARAQSPGGEPSQDSQRNAGQSPQPNGDRDPSSSPPGEQAGSTAQARSGQRAGEQPQQPGAQPDQPTPGPGRNGDPREQQTAQNRNGERTRDGSPQSGGQQSGGGFDPRRDLDRILQESTAPLQGAITGDDYLNWSDRLRNVEEMLDAPDLRNGVATARDRARRLRQDFKRDGKAPDWAVVQLQVLQPLLEVRDRVREELARRGSREALVPIDRDPVPGKYSDLVRRYYEQLGKDQ